LLRTGKKAIAKLPEKTKLILNADDPQIAYIGITANQIKQLLHFSLSSRETDTQSLQAADSVTCPKCGNKLTFKNITFSHLGEWHCDNCDLHRPKPTISSFSYYPLSGMYSKYNTHAAVLVLEDLGMDKKIIADTFRTFTPAFGRQEIIKYQGRNVQLFLSKNPTSFNQSYQTIKDLHASTLLLVLNDRIPDGRDISWIWDVDLAELEKFKQIFVSGDRAYDMALRLKYELGNVNYEKKVKTFEFLNDAINIALNQILLEETLYILPTYSAMLDSRKILIGKKIL